ncbi:copper resistance CopC family protein [Demetria terragena]|uniref:copper resistance CopC family protein n=1 Tax=Demetria terragena TaxID=63959 RepID=UPI0003620FA5|nr:copper resistance CopC family protein [Demetria terragena]
MLKHIRALIVLVLATCGLSFAMAGTAAAHDRLLSSDPADGATVSAPKNLTLTYSAEILPTGSRVEVKGPDGSPASSGEPKADGAKVVQALDASSPGKYAVTWRVTSSDGHPISGTLSFTVRGKSTTSSATSSAAPSTASSAAEKSSGGVGGGAETPSASDNAASEGTSEPTMAPTTTVDTDATSNRPVIVIGLAVVAALGLVGAGMFARRRLRDDE